MVERRSPSDRRHVEIDFNRRKRKRRQKAFYYRRQAYLADTNYFQNVYFARYFEFVGEAREELLKNVLGEHFPALASSGVIVSTVSTDIHYKKMLSLFDKFRVEIRIAKYGRVKITLSYSIIEETHNAVNAIGSMAICFLKDGKPIPVPEAIGEGCKKLNLI